MHTCVAMLETEGGSRWSLEAPPFQPSVIYRFKEHLTIDHRAFLLPSPVKAGNKAAMIDTGRAMGAES